MMRKFRFPMVSARAAAAFALALAAVFFTPMPTSAIPSFFDICKAEAPMPEIPGQGVLGQLSDIGTRADVEYSPETIWSNRGLTGMLSESYDLGCTANPTSYYTLARSSLENTRANSFVAVGHVFTTLTASMEHRAWEPQWITSFIGQFVNRALGPISDRIWVPFSAIGLIATTIFILLQLNKENLSNTAGHVAWAIAVITLAMGIFSSPLFVAESVQSGGAMINKALNAESSEISHVDALTDRVTYSVHYQGWLRRTFGDENSAIAKEFGAQLFETRGLSYAERAEIQNDPSRYSAITEAKQNKFKEIAEKIKERDPDNAYRNLQGDPSLPKKGTAAMESVAAFAVNAGRFIGAAVMITSVIFLVVLGIAWLAAAFYIVTPPGRELGINMLNNAVRVIGNVITTVIGLYLYIVYSEAALAPGISMWWSIILMIIGTIIFWTTIRPDRKLFSVLTLGHVNGSGRMARRLGRIAGSVLMSYVTGKIVADSVKKDKIEYEVSHDQDKQTPEQPVTPPPPSPSYERPIPTAIEAAPAPIVHEGVIYDPPVVDNLSGDSMASHVTIDGEVIQPEPRFAAPDRTLPSGEYIYQRGEEKSEDWATPPPSGSVGEVEIYRSGIQDGYEFARTQPGSFDSPDAFNYHDNISEGHNETN